MVTQCDRLLAEFKKGRKLTLMDITNELRIGNHSARISDLRKKGHIIKCEEIKTNQGETGLYSLEEAPKSSIPDTIIVGKPDRVRYTEYQCPKAHKFKFYADGPEWVTCEVHFEKGKRLKEQKHL